MASPTITDDAVAGQNKARRLLAGYSQATAAARTEPDLLERLSLVYLLALGAVDRVPGGVSRSPTYPTSGFSRALQNHFKLIIYGSEQQ